MNLNLATVDIRVVEPGFVVRNEATGQVVTIDDTTAAFVGRICFCTEAVRAALRAHPMTTVIQ